MKKNQFHASKLKNILIVILSTALFSFFRGISVFLPILSMNTFAERGWSLMTIIVVSVSLHTVSSGFVVLLIMPWILGFTNLKSWLVRFLRLDRKIILVGIFSFLGFCILAAVISLSMGIFKGNLSAVFSYPDIRPDPDVVGIGYFLLALIPGIWEELAFRGLILTKLRIRFGTWTSILLSALFFGLFHLINLLTQSPSLAISGVIMASLFGIGWGYMTIKTGSVIPAMISHYLVDALGQIFLTVDTTDPALSTGYFLLLTLLFPVFNIILARATYGKLDEESAGNLIEEKPIRSPG